MILLTLLLAIVLIVILATIIGLFLIGIGGGIFTVILADLIVCVAVICWLIKWLTTRKKKH